MGERLAEECNARAREEDAGVSMHIKSFRVENFRRLKSVRVDLDEKTTIFVGANNSGKTSATHVFQRFLDPKSHFQIYDFSADCWEAFDRLSSSTSKSEPAFPKIYFDLWFEVDAGNLHRVVDLFPSLDWDWEPIGVRMAFEPKDPDSLMANYEKARLERKPSTEQGASAYQPWPQNITDYLRKRLTNEYEVRHYRLDARRCDGDLLPQTGYDPLPLGSNGNAIVASLLRVDFLNAQRHLTDTDSHGRGEDLSRRLSRYYQRNLPSFEADINALNAIAESETALNDHFARAFNSILKRIEVLGYPGAANPGISLKASLNVQNLLSTSARVHYALPEGDPLARSLPTLPDQYNGLGFKNLIYMGVEILDFHHAWKDAEDRRPPVHLIMIEEPEAHLHAQLQQVFIRRVFDLLPDAEPGFQTQLVVTTHSSHVLYESNFQPIRYFCRSKHSSSPHRSEVKNLSDFYQGEEEATRRFLQQYLKLTHCDLFFADAAVLVEGNVERLLLPLIIERNVPKLKECHLTILEVGGAFAHKFHELLQFLEITALVITDLDSVYPLQDTSASGAEGEACMTTVPAAVTCNESLRHWFPQVNTISGLLDLPDEQKIIHAKSDDSVGKEVLRIAYQTRQPANWLGETAELAGRTLEEAFALENLAWTQGRFTGSASLSVRGSNRMNLDELHQAVYKKVRNLDKTSFALSLIAELDATWRAPRYIVDGLTWLRDQMVAALSDNGDTAPDLKVET